MAVTPYKTSTEGKKRQIRAMFNNIAPKYDFLNHFLSAGIDKVWRKRAIKLLEGVDSPRVLDIATGTGDLALQAMVLKPKKVIGVDLSPEMIKVGKKKIKERGLGNIIRMVEGDSENLPLRDNYFDIAMVAFGVRNFENLEKGLKEINRVVKPGGLFMVLEFSNPTSFPFKNVYNFYSNRILPICGSIISHDNSAYTYLPESVAAFPQGEAFVEKLQGAGFKSLKVWKQTMGIATIYLSEKLAQ